MGLVKRTYVDGETVITADNLNDIQDEIIQNASDISTKGTYSKPSGGIPSTDLASAVQTSLGKADTALQSSDIDNTLTVSGKAADAKKTGDEISGVKNTLTQLKTDTFGNINLTGTNNTGSTITAGTFFYNNGTLVRAKTNILNGSAITIGTNTETVTAGGLNALNSYVIPQKVTPSVYTQYSGSITINFNNCFRIGNIVVVNFRFTVSADIEHSQVLFEGLPIADTQTSPGQTFGGVANNHGDLVQFSMGLSLDGTTTSIFSVNRVPAQMYVVNTIYVCV